MRKTVIILITVCLVCSLNVSLRAQPMFGLSQKQSPFLFPFAEPEASLVGPVHVEPYAPAVVPDFRVSTALQRHARFLFLPQPESLLVDYYGNLTRRFLPLKTEDKKPVEPSVNRRVFNALFNAKREDEKAIVRRQWKEAFGVDVWFAYYKAREVEDWVKQRLSVKIGKFKGEPVVDRSRVFYTFRSRF